MNHTITHHPHAALFHSLSMAFVLCLGMASVPAFAANAGAAPSRITQAQTQYQHDMAACKNGQSQENKATCEKEAGAAFEAAKHGQLISAPAGSYQENADNRCANLPGDQRQDCMTLMSDPNAKVQGSVNSGGILRETTITIPGQPEVVPATPRSESM